MGKCLLRKTLICHFIHLSKVKNSMNVTLFQWMMQTDQKLISIPIDTFEQNKWSIW